jgi:hypothetical protein
LEKDIRAAIFIAAVSKQMECAVACAGNKRLARCALKLAKYVRPENLRTDRAVGILRVWRRGFISMGVQNQRADLSIDFSRLQTPHNKNLTNLHVSKRIELTLIMAK